MMSKSKPSKAPKEQREIRRPLKRAKPGKADVRAAAADEHLQCLGPDWDAELKGPQKARMRLFVLEYLKDRNATQAAIRAGYSPKGAAQIATKLLRKAQVVAVIEAHEKALAKRVGLEVEEYARQTLEMSLVDAQAISQTRRVCCRFCHAPDPLRPQITPSEWQRVLANHEFALANALAAGKAEPVAPEPPADWFDVRKAPNPDCLECRGEGVLDVFIADSRTLQGAARRLFQGVEQGRDGIKVKTLDQGAAWVNYGRIIGAFKDQGEGAGAVDVVPEMLNKLFGDVQEVMATRRNEVRARRRAGGGT